MNTMAHQTPGSTAGIENTCDEMGRGEMGRDEMGLAFNIREDFPGMKALSFAVRLYACTLFETGCHTG